MMTLAQELEVIEVQAVPIPWSIVVVIVLAVGLLAYRSGRPKRKP
jgi:hypothetical protein